MEIYIFGNVIKKVWFRQKFVTASFNPVMLDFFLASEKDIYRSKLINDLLKYNVLTINRSFFKRRLFVCIYPRTYERELYTISFSKKLEIKIEINVISKKQRVILGTCQCDALGHVTITSIATYKQ